MRMNCGQRQAQMNIMGEKIKKILKKAPNRMALGLDSNNDNNDKLSDTIKRFD